MREIVWAWRRNRPAAGQRLRALRLAARLSQLQLAEASGITNDSICRLELGRRAPQAATIARLARALDLDPHRFVASDSGDEAAEPDDDEVAEPVAGAGVAGRS
jgi:transcriptional regulator with XRE-family HTH domain